MADYSTFAAILANYGVMDFLLPFLLVFTIVFAVLQKTKILGERKNFNVILALVLGLSFVVPHVIGSYPLGYDPVEVLNNALPSISLVSIAAIMLLLLMGIFGTGFAAAAAPIIAIVAIGFVLYIFGASLDLWVGPYDAFDWWTAETTELMIVILVFGLIVWLVTKDESHGKGADTLKGVWKGISSLFEKTGGGGHGGH
ncbi:hypothetical protein HYV86_00395 [Candidatus Woesearchaeota archaeon]|nr:hypothetical protein [Candidatus Woesearchaeota archaeon]